MTTTASTTAVVPRKRRRIFLWVFLAIQALFITWLIVGGVSAGGTSVDPDVASACSNGQWHVLYSSHAECVSQMGDLYNSAKGIGTGIGLAMIVGLWMVTDFLVGGGYAIYRLAKSRH
jgi:hypothetical protein